MDKYDSKYHPEFIPRFLSKIKIDDNGCWNWIGCLNRNGYGTIHLRPFGYLSHRFIFAYYYGHVDSSLTIDHLCRNPACVNPFHMEQVPPEVNRLRGNCQSMINSRKTTCIKGHPFDDDNTYITPSTGARQCRKCKCEYGKLKKQEDCVIN